MVVSFSLILHVLAVLVLLVSSATLGISCYQVCHEKKQGLAETVFGYSLKTALVAVIAVFLTGFYAFNRVAHRDVVQFAAINGVLKGSESAPFTVVPGVNVPVILSIMADGTTKANVPGFNEILYVGYLDYDSTYVSPIRARMGLSGQALQAHHAYEVHLQHHNYPVAKMALDIFNSTSQYLPYKDLEHPEDMMPSVNRSFWAFHMMLYFGLALLLLILLLVWREEVR